MTLEFQKKQTIEKIQQFSIKWAAALSLLVVSSSQAAIEFEEVTQQAGISYVGESWGIAWGDYNGDGYADVWSNHHRLFPSLYVNNRDGTFTDVLPTIFTGNPYADTHGMAWADFDNDGDQDLMESTGGSTSTNLNHYNHLYVNDDGVLTDKAGQLGVDYPENRGRTPLWVDYNRDGLLDLVAMGAPRDGVGYSAIFRQTEFTFVNSDNETGFSCDPAANLALLSDLTGDGMMEIICQQWSFPQRIYDITHEWFVDIGHIFPNATYVHDAITADFNNDLMPDVFLGRFPVNSSNTVQKTDVLVESRVSTAWFPSVSGIEKGFKFKTSGTLDIDVAIPYLTRHQVYIGASGWNPPKYGTGVMRNIFQISSEDSANWGIKPFSPAEEDGLYMGYDPDLGEWTMLITGGTRYQYYWARMLSENPITSIEPINYDQAGVTQTPRLYLNTGGGFVNKSIASGVQKPLNCFTNVAGDFDNDMDLDIYLGCQFAPENLPNVLFENQGDGTFVMIPGAGGAEGSIFGGTNNVAVADYDNDGFLDLYVVNGHGEPPLADGPDQLFRNKGNSNHWVEIDLEGVNSNRDGIGATVFVAAGGVTQMREQNSGTHTWAQNHQRLHFGLGNNTIIEDITIVWPDGHRQSYQDILPDQILHLTEDVATPSIAGQPGYGTGDEQGVFIWKTHFDGPYHIRAVADTQQQNFAIQLLSDQAVVSSSPIKTLPTESFTPLETGFAFQALISSTDTGIDVQLSPGAKGLIAVTQNSQANPRNIYLGQNRDNPSPAGWIINTGEIAPITDYKVGRNVSTRIGSTTGNDLTVRATANRFNHHWNYQLLLPSGYLFNPSHLETGDSYQQTGNLLDITSLVTAPWQDGFTVNFASPQWVGVTMQQDKITQFHKGMIYNQAAKSLPANAYWLPYAEPYNEPDYANGDKVAIYIWKDEGNTNTWRMRFTAGGGVSQRFYGSIRSSEPFSDLDFMSSIEDSDNITLSEDGKTLNFEIIVDNIWYDGFNIQVPEGATLSLDLIEQHNYTESVYIGKDQWPVVKLPVDLSGW